MSNSKRTFSMKFLPEVIGSSFVLSLALSISACGEEKAADYRTPRFVKEAEAIVEKPNAILIDFSLPDRSQRPELAALNAYYLGLVGEGETCPAGEVIEMAGSWDNANTEIKFQVNGKCNYKMTMRYGIASEGLAFAFALTNKITWMDDIKPIVDANCVSCHAEFANYADVVANGEMVVRQVESLVMPQTAPLADLDIAKFLAWKDGGYEEKTAVVVPTEKQKSLAKVYYESNRNEYLMMHEMLGRTTYQLRRSLWIQPEGEAAGMVPREVKTWTAAD